MEANSCVRLLGYCSQFLGGFSLPASAGSSAQADSGSLPYFLCRVSVPQTRMGVAQDKRHSSMWGNVVRPLRRFFRCRRRSSWCLPHGIRSAQGGIFFNSGLIALFIDLTRVTRYIWGGHVYRMSSWSR